MTNVNSILICQFANSHLPNLESALHAEGYRVFVVCAPEIAGNPSPTETVDLVIVDASASGGGEEVCLECRRRWPYAPLVLLTERSVPVDERCLKLSCGNVLYPPFTLRKVLNKVKKLLDDRSGKIIRAGRLVLDLRTRCVYRDGLVRRLTPKQAHLLRVFMEHPGQTLTRKFLMETVWNTSYMGDTRTLDVHVRWIRERIEEDPSSPRYLRTVRGVGYHFSVPDGEG